MNGISKKLSAGGVALGVALGSYGIASAATGSTTTSSSATPGCGRGPQSCLRD